MEIITNMTDYIQYIPQRHTELTSKLTLVQGKLTDVEHEIENSKFNVCQGYYLSKQLKDLRVERRNLKNELELIEQLNNFVFNNKKLEIDLFKVKTVMTKIKDRHDNWFYKPRAPENETEIG